MTSTPTDNTDASDQSKPRQQRRGLDARQKGFYWHRTEIVRQYAPLIGLDGIGLLDSYSVWTDNREGSETQGAAFPGLEDEEVFYGIDRDHLAVLNRLLEACGLIAISIVKARIQVARERNNQKEVYWQPVNKQTYTIVHKDDYTLTTETVIRVVQLAFQDPMVYRVIRHIFLPTFKPIERAREGDTKNPWYLILPQVREMSQWRILARRAAAEKAQGRARVMKGFATRQATSADETGTGSPASADETGTGSPASADETGVGSLTSADETGVGLPTSADETGSKQYQIKEIVPSTSTTTTTTSLSAVPIEAGLRQESVAAESNLPVAIRVAFQALNASREIGPEESGRLQVLAGQFSGKTVMNALKTAQSQGREHVGPAYLLTILTGCKQPVPIHQVPIQGDGTAATLVSLGDADPERQLAEDQAAAQDTSAEEPANRCVLAMPMSATLAEPLLRPSSPGASGDGSIPPPSPADSLSAAVKAGFQTVNGGKAITAQEIAGLAALIVVHGEEGLLHAMDIAQSRGKSFVTPAYLGMILSDPAARPMVAPPRAARPGAPDPPVVVGVSPGNGGGIAPSVLSALRVSAPGVSTPEVPASELIAGLSEENARHLAEVILAYHSANGGREIGDDDQRGLAYLVGGFGHEAVTRVIGQVRARGHAFVNTGYLSQMLAAEPPVQRGPMDDPLFGRVWNLLVREQIVKAGSPAQAQDVAEFLETYPDPAWWEEALRRAKRYSAGAGLSLVVRILADYKRTGSWEKPRPERKARQEGKYARNPRTGTKAGGGVHPSWHDWDDISTKDAKSGGKPFVWDEAPL